MSPTKEAKVTKYNNITFIHIYIEHLFTFINPLKNGKYANMHV